MGKLRVALEIIRTVCIIFILFIIIGLIVFIYVNKDTISEFVTGITNNMNNVGKMATSINNLATSVSVWVEVIDSNNLLNTIISTANGTKIIIEKNKDIDLNQIMSSLKQIILLMNNITDVVNSL
ncbi:MAG: hypothetical protein MUO21_09415 [Nitrososphaeraceae archaeon]|nr:hypothetical protein [Nitrososphaeraceae archaeon]